jgi:hypothetical protein
VVLEVQHDASFVLVEELEVAREHAHRLAAGWLDLEHVGAVLGDQLGGVGPGSPHGEIEHAQTCEQCHMARVSYPNERSVKLLGGLLLLIDIL